MTDDYCPDCGGLLPPTGGHTWCDYDPDDDQEDRTDDRDTSGPALSFSAQSETCGACKCDVTTDTVLDTETGRYYFGCPACGEANVEASGGLTDDE